MKLGICIVTCDRPQYLSNTLSSLEWKLAAERVIVDNGGHSYGKVKKIAHRYGCEVIDGHCSNCPHGQNMGLKHLASRGCTVVLKSDDDIRYEGKHLSRLLGVYKANRAVVGVVGGVFWSEDTKDVLKFKHGYWVDGEGKKAGEAVPRYRLDTTRVFQVKHLHCSFLYDVESAMNLKRKTQKLRGGAFADYLSLVAFREETEFTYLMWSYLNRRNFLVTDAIAYHHYAPGGIRKQEKGQGALSIKDEQKVVEVVTKLTGKTMVLDPIWVKP